MVLFQIRQNFNRFAFLYERSALYSWRPMSVTGCHKHKNATLHDCPVGKLGGNCRRLPQRGRPGNDEAIHFYAVLTGEQLEVADCGLEERGENTKGFPETAPEIVLMPNPTTGPSTVIAPNNKLYASAAIDTVAFHVIHHPNAIGNACEFDIGGFGFPSYYPKGEMYYFPNYRLGPILGQRGARKKNLIANRTTSCANRTMSFCRKTMLFCKKTSRKC